MPERVLCVSAILCNSYGEVLLQQRDNKPDLPFPGYWTLPGGKVEENETPQEAIRRELMEEIGVELTPAFWKHYDRPLSDALIVVQYIFTGRSDQPISHLVLNEGQALDYFGYNELANLPIAFGFDNLLREFFSKSDTL